MDSADIFPFKDTDSFKDCDLRTYSDRMCSVIRLALIRDASLYEWLILNFNEIMDKDDDALAYMFSKLTNTLGYYDSIGDDRASKERKAVLYGKNIAKALKRNLASELSDGEYEGLGMICCSFLSYKRDMLSKEEFYEIRDMFVPFGMTISLDKFDVDKVVDDLYADEDFNKELRSMPLLKRIGKVSFVSGVSKDEVKDAIGSLIVEWD